jgi:AcrR family transcriptional regulator
VSENQRERLIAGIITAVAENGYDGATIAVIVKAAGISRGTLYENFANKEECFAAAYDAALAYVRGRTLTAAEAEEEWSGRVRSGLEGLLGALAAEPELASFFLIAPASAGDEFVERHHLAMRALVGDLVEGAPGGPEPSETREQALAGGLSRLIVGRLNAGEAAALPQMLPDLVELVATPFVGSEEAVKVARES